MDPVTWLINYVAGLFTQLVTVLQGGVQQTINTASSYIAPIVSTVRNSIESVTSYLGNALAGVISDIKSSLTYLITNIVPTLNEIVTGILTSLKSVLAPLFAGLTDMLQGVERAISTVIDTLRNLFNGLWEKIEQIVSGLMASIQDAFYSLIQRIQEVFAGLIGTIREWIGSAVTWIQSLVSAVTGSITGLVETIKTTIVNAWNSVVGTIKQVYAAVVAEVQKEYEILLHGAESILDTVSKRVEDLASALKEGAATLGKDLSAIAKEEIAPVADIVTQYFKRFEGWLSGTEIQALTQGFQELTAPHSVNLESRVDAAALAGRLVPDSTLGQFIFLTAFHIASALSLWSGVYQANSQRVLLEYGDKFPYQALSVADAAAAYHRGDMSLQDAVAQIRRQGYDDKDSNQMVRNTEQPAGLGDLTAMLHRGIIDQATWENGFRRLGIDPAFQRPYLALGMVIPSVQDLVSMAVREAFSPDIAERFGQFQDFPQEFETYAAQLGLSVDWAKRYWAAHWSLPSATQGFEMFHRGIIKEDDLKLLLKALDVMPFWRDNLIELAYNPITRVDIRRANKAGVIPDSDLQRRYQNIGYSPDDAKTLADLTVELNAPKKKSVDTDIAKLTVSQIVSFYQDGALPRSEAHDLLLKLGASEETAGLYLAHADLQQHAQDRTRQAQNIIALVKAGALGKTEAETRLRSIGLTETEVERYIAAVEDEFRTTTRLPSHADAVKWFKLGLINMDVFKEILFLQNYAQRWIDLYAAEIQLELANAKGPKKSA